MYVCVYLCTYIYFGQADSPRQKREGQLVLEALERVRSERAGNGGVEFGGGNALSGLSDAGAGSPV